MVDVSVSVQATLADHAKRIVINVRRGASSGATTSAPGRAHRMSQTVCQITSVEQKVPQAAGYTTMLRQPRFSIDPPSRLGGSVASSASRTYLAGVLWSIVFRSP
jgi:hypothetical protein